MGLLSVALITRAETSGCLRGWLTRHELILSELRLEATVLGLPVRLLVAYESAVGCLELLHLQQLLLHHELLLHRHLL